MFNEQVGGQIAWLLPLAAVGLVAGLWADAPRAADRPAPRRLRALRRLGARARRRLLQPAGHLPPVLRERAGARRRRAVRRRGVVLGAGRAGPGPGSRCSTLDDRRHRVARGRLLGRTPDFAPWLRTAIPVAAAIALVGVAGAAPAARAARLLVAGALAAAFAVGAGPASYASPRRAVAQRQQRPRRAVRARRRHGRHAAAWAAEAASSSEAIAYLQAHQGSATYLVAAVGLADDVADHHRHGRAGRDDRRLQRPATRRRR